MGLKDFVVAIPSYKRAELLRDQTLRVLKSYKIPQNRIYVFVANSDQEKIYSNVLKKGFSNVNIVIGELGLREIRNFMPKYFKHISLFIMTSSCLLISLILSPIG